ncbi:MAG TPA: sarcosine oxidase subunit alpha family protein [Steroidobacteraceae bacterium]|nr:sarcosine oxidase subunit alpha family protein [Steroidobacteraceae bacterium]
MSDARQPARLAAGGLLDRNDVRRFRFDGREYVGYAGDTLASALVANGVRLFGRSFKYHRPRGLLSAGPEEPNALVELRSGPRREPNTRATGVELYDGLEAASQNRWPSLRFDVNAVNGLFSPIFVAGFYYKTFMWPASFWEKVYEPLIRRAAGLGKPPLEPDPDHYDKAWLHCDVLVIGGGPAGLAAALAAARAGARVVIADEDFVLGGRALAERRTIDGQPAAAWAQDVVRELRSMPDVRVLPRTTVFGAYDGMYGAVERIHDHVAEPPAFEPRQRVWRIVARQAVLAAGAIERPLTFGDNDRPGVMLAGAVRSYLNRFAARPGRRAVVFTDNDDGWATAADLRAAGAEVAAVVDARNPETVRELARQLPDVECVAGVVTRAHGAHGVHTVQIRTHARSSRRIRCDLVATSGGWTPTLHLTSHRGARPRFDEARAIFVPGDVPAGLVVAGAANGEFALADALKSGHRAGVAAADAVGCTRAVPPAPAGERESTRCESLWRVRNCSGKSFVDFQNDVTTNDVELAEREGFRSVEHLKRYTTLGMATDQGKTSNVTGLALMAERTSRSIAATGATAFRPPYTPVTMGALAGHHRGRDFRPTRLPPSHAWAARRGAVFMETGPWLRAQWFPLVGEQDWFEPTCREVLAVRTRVGVCDVSTLGKIDVQGPDAGAFLDRLYANVMSSLAVGRVRYGIMLREDGFVMDDGTAARLAPDRFVITTTTAHAVKVYQHMHFCHQVLWPELDVQFVSVTDQWAQYAVAGPRSRELLSRVLDPACDISNASLPYMAARPIALRDGQRGRLFRISFSGELAYEVAVPARGGEALMEALFVAGADLGVTAYGLEALNVMRIEKGHMTASELNGQTTAHDLGLERMLSGTKDFVGATLARRAHLVDPARPRLVGLLPVDRKARIAGGMHFVPQGAERTAANDLGHVTSAGYSPNLQQWIGLGLLARGPERHGEHVLACDPLRGTETLVEVRPTVFVDREGARLRG